MNEEALRAEMCEVARDLWTRGLVGATEGNLTCRLDTSHILSTPAGAVKGKLLPDDLVALDLDGGTAGAGTPSSEIALHLRIYRESPECAAIVHAHPPVATGFALAGHTIPQGVLPEADLVLGAVPLVPFAAPGTTEVGEAIAPFLPEGRAFLLASHGAVTVGADLREAYLRMETLERVARVVLIARLLNGG